MFTITHVGGKVNNPLYTEIICGQESDIDNLPVDPNTIAWGSHAKVIGEIDNGGTKECFTSNWLLDSDYVWKRV
jgi:hypothetical protein